MTLAEGCFREDELVEVESPPLGDALTFVLGHVYRNRGNVEALGSIRAALVELMTEADREIVMAGAAN